MTGKIEMHTLWCCSVARGPLKTRLRCACTAAGLTYVVAFRCRSVSRIDHRCWRKRASRGSRTLRGVLDALRHNCRRGRCRSQTIVVVVVVVMLLSFSLSYPLPLRDGYEIQRSINSPAPGSRVTHFLTTFSDRFALLSSTGLGRLLQQACYYVLVDGFGFELTWL
jgi:hypothetical protein